MMKKSRVSKRGFTLIELIIAMSLFIIVASIAIGAIVSVFGANKRAQVMRTVVDNLNMSLEDMVRTVRFGGTYHCGTVGVISDPRDCSAGDTFLAVDFEGVTVIYRLNGNAIQKSSDGGANYKAITSTDTVIDHLRFYVDGSSDSDSEQPYVMAVIKGRVGNGSAQSSFSIQTVMSQRTLDI